MGIVFDLLLDFLIAVFLPDGRARKAERREQRQLKRQQKRQHEQPGASPRVAGQDSYFLPQGADLPHFEYRPSRDGHADPGEVVWAWVPFEDDSSQGKDRPVLVLAEVSGGFVCAQMTSKDHVDFKETSWGRRWMDIGTGDWDRQRRPSEVRLDRFVFVPAHSVRREGGRVSPQIFNQVIEAIKAVR